MGMHAAAIAAAAGSGGGGGGGADADADAPVNCCSRLRCCCGEHFGMDALRSSCRKGSVHWCMVAAP